MIAPAMKGPPKPLTPARLEKAALFYLQRYAASSGQLRAVLRRRLRRAEQAGVAECGAADIEAVIDRLQRNGILNDAAFAEMKAASLARQGRSHRAMQRKLQQLGLEEAEQRAALAAAGLDGEAELARAFAFARRRRLGPYRAAAERAARRERDLAALGRQGFAYEIARQVIDAEEAPPR